PARARRRRNQDARGLVAVVAHRTGMLGIEPYERPDGCRVLTAVDDHCWLAAEHVEHLLLIAAGLVVLRDLPTGRYVDNVYAKRPHPERPADERPVTGPLALVGVGEGDAQSGSSRWLARTDDLASVAAAGVAALLPSCLRGGPEAGY